MRQPERSHDVPATGTILTGRVGHPADSLPGSFYALPERVDIHRRAFADTRSCWAFRTSTVVRWPPPPSRCTPARATPAARTSDLAELPSLTPQQHMNTPVAVAYQRLANLPDPDLQAGLIGSTRFIVIG